MTTVGPPTAADPAALRSLAHKVIWRLVAPLSFLVLLSSLDRSNISIAALGMNAEIGLTPEMYGRGAGLFFFLGYILLQYPHTAILRRVHARRWVTATVTIWGCVATMVAFIQTPMHFYILRFLLGIAEGGFSSGATYLVALWMPRRYRAVAIGATMLAIPLSQIIGAPLSGWLMTLPLSLGGLDGWRLMIATEGVATVIFGLLAWRVFVDRLDDARWLTAEEKRAAAQEAEADVSERAVHGSMRFLRDWKFWAATATWFCLLAGAQGIIFWMAQVVRATAGGNALEVGLITALPWIGVGAGMILVAQNSDRTGERRLHLAVCAALGGACLLGAFLIGPGWQAAALLVLGGFGLGGAQGVFWPIPISLLSQEDSGRGITVLNMVGNSAGLVMTPLIGLIRQRTGEFGPSVYLLSGVIVVATILALFLKPRATAL